MWIGTEKGLVYIGEASETGECWDVYPVYNDNYPNDEIDFWLGMKRSAPTELPKEGFIEAVEEILCLLEQKKV